MAILRHELPDGSAHFDLLLAEGDADDAARVVPTWRCPDDPMSLAAGSTMPVQPLPPHRGLYLRLHAPRELDHGRGRVQAVHSGWHARRHGVLWMATAELGERAFTLQGGTLRREADDQVKAS